MELISIDCPFIKPRTLFCVFGGDVLAWPNNVSTTDKDDELAFCHCGPCSAHQEHDSLTERIFKTIVNMKLSPVTMHFDLFH